MVKQLSAEFDKLNVALDDNNAEINQLVADNVADNMTDIDTDLSDLAVDLLVLAQELIDAKVRLEEMTKNGWMDMAKARYVMGMTTVSALQLPKADGDTEEDNFIDASTTVHTQQCIRDDSGVINYHQFSLKYKSEESLTKLTKKEEGLRQRKIENTDEVEKKGSGVEEISKDDNKTDNAKDDKKKMNEPLRWFSAMPPAPLKQSQKCFQSALEIVVDIANIQSEINGIQSRIKYLKRMKLEQ